jgi:uncharacterized protein (DUF433 family)
MDRLINRSLQWRLECAAAPAGESLILSLVAHRATVNYMSHPLSVRLNDATIARLGRHAQRMHLAPRTLAQRYVEEGLRMDEHPLIRFADGPAGRRARLAGTGKDVWEIIAAVRDNDGDAAETARYLELALGLVQAAISYRARTPRTGARRPGRSRTPRLGSALRSRGPGRGTDGAPSHRHQ